MTDPPPGTMILTMTERRPLVVIEGRRRSVLSRLDERLEVARVDAWTIVRGWAAPLGRERVICTGWIETADDARRALLAAVAGAGLVVGSSAIPETIDRFVDDLRRLGPVDHVGDRPRTGSPGTAPVDRALLGLVAEGLSVDDAAARLGLDREVARARLRSAHSRLGVGSTAEAIAAVLSRGR